MKIKSRYIILLLVVVILLVVTGILFALEPVAVKQPITMKGVFFSKTPQSVNLSLPPELQNIPSAPAPLTSQVRNNAINQIRGAIGLQAIIPANMSIPIVPAHLILTPDAPKSGLSSYSVYKGNNFPDPKIWTGWGLHTVPFTRLSASSSYYLLFNFNTIAGKTYMVDFWVSPNNLIHLEGAFTGDVTPQGYHLIIGFTANSPFSTIKLWGKSTSEDFFRCELTQVN